MLAAVTFDFWNTIFVDPGGRERDRRRAEYLRAVLAECGEQVGDLAIQDALAKGYDHFDRQWRDEHRTPPADEIVNVVLDALRSRVPLEARERITTYFSRMILEVAPEPTPGATTVIAELAERYKLAVICDTGYAPGSVLRELLDKHGLTAAFDYLYFSNEGGVSKPDVRVFRRVLEELGVPAYQAAHVGDMERTDIAGAHAAGLLAVHFVGANANDADESTADAVVRRFADLPAVLGSLVCPGC
jgi:putative hydrolase of the HAD superfamily